MARLLTKKGAERYFEVEDIYGYLDYLYMCGNKKDFKETLLKLEKAVRLGFIMYLMDSELLNTNEGIMALKVSVLNKMD